MQAGRVAGCALMKKALTMGRRVLGVTGREGTWD